MEHKIKINQSELTTIWDYFIARNTKYSNEKSHKPESVMPRRAFVNAVHKYSSYPEIGGSLDMDRASAYHYRRTHDGCMIYQDYRDLYADAVLCVSKFVKGDLFNADDAMIKDIQELRAEVLELRSKLLRLKEYVGKQVELFVD